MVGGVTTPLNYVLCMFHCPQPSLKQLSSPHESNAISFLSPIQKIFTCDLEEIRFAVRSRVENFLAEHASEYVEYLGKKRKLPEVFRHLDSAVELNSEIKELMQSRTMAVGQYQKCLNCIYGATIPQGFLCTIH